MNITTGYYVITLILFFAGIYFICIGFSAKSTLMPVRYRDGPAYRFEKWKRDLMDQNRDEIFVSAGIHISMKKYQAVRQMFMVIILCISILKLLQGRTEDVQNLITAGVLIYYLTYPKQMAFGRRTPFWLIMAGMKKRRADRLDEELAGIIMQMRNIILSRNQHLSANYLISSLIPFTKLTKKAFTTALRFIRQGEIQAAAENFEKIFGTNLGSSFAAVLVKLDELPAEEFREQLDVIQKKAESERRTRRNSKAARINAVRYSFAMMEAFIIAGNFMYLIVIDSIKTLVLLQ